MTYEISHDYQNYRRDETDDILLFQPLSPSLYE